MTEDAGMRGARPATPPDEGRTVDLGGVTPEPPAGLPPSPPSGPEAPTPAPPLDAVAVVALVLGVLVAPLGIVFGLVSLARIRRRGFRGTGLAVSGIVVGILLTLALVGLVLAALLLWSTGHGGYYTTVCGGNGVCESTVHGGSVTVGDHDLTVLEIREGSADVQGSRDPAPTTVTVGTPFSFENRRFSLLSATDGVAVFRYDR